MARDNTKKSVELCTGAKIAGMFLSLVTLKYLYISATVRWGILEGLADEMSVLAFKILEKSSSPRKFLSLQKNQEKSHSMLSELLPL